MIINTLFKEMAAFWRTLELLVLRPALVSKLASYKRSKSGREIIVLANGPSVNRLDPAKLVQLQKQGVDLLALNDFALAPLWETLKPNYYVLSDPVNFFIFDGLFDPDFIAEQKVNAERVAILLRSIKATIFVPVQYYAAAVRIFRECEIVALNNSHSQLIGGYANPLFPRKYPDRTSYKGLSMALYMGYKTIYVCGFDNDLIRNVTVTKKNKIYFNYRYFWSIGPKSECFNDRATKFRDCKLSFWLQVAIRDFLCLEQFAKQGANIINLDPDSLVDAFAKEHSLDVYAQNQVLEIVK